MAYKETPGIWLRQKALGFFRNFLKNHTGYVEDNNAFKLSGMLTSVDAIAERLESEIGSESMQAMKERKDRRTRLCLDDDIEDVVSQIWHVKATNDIIRNILLEEIDLWQEQHAPLQEQEDLARRFCELQQTLGLSPLEMDIFLVQYSYVHTPLHIDLTHPSRLGRINFTAKCLDVDLDTIRRNIQPAGKLRRFQCIDHTLDYNRDLNDFICGMTNEPLENAYYHSCSGEVLPKVYFNELFEKHGDMLNSIIASTHDGHAANILLYGTPGTGKTSFAQTLIRECGRKCYCINQASTQVDCEPDLLSLRNDDDDGFKQFDRLSALQICDMRVLNEKSVIVVDEADNLLGGDKGRLNDVLDSVQTPTIWISNNASDELDESCRRRFDYSIKFEPLNARQRMQIWKNNTERLNIANTFTNEQLESFSQKYCVSAGIITLVSNNIRNLLNGGAEPVKLVDRLMAQHCELLNVDKKMRNILPAKDYSLDGLCIRGKFPLEKIIASVRRYQETFSSDTPDVPRMNLLLSGAPGTGKTEFVKYLGSVLDTQVVVKMGSDLLSKWVGETEANISKAFQEAEDTHAILFFDEIDGLVRSRQQALRSWEVSQVNEILNKMENFSGIMVGATNFSENLDPAIIRRFTFKLDFDYLDARGKKIFFETMFKTSLKEDEALRLASIPKLTPGDFRTVRQELFYLAENATNHDRLDLLEQESRAKKDNRFAGHEKIGFGE